MPIYGDELKSTVALVDLLKAGLSLWPDQPAVVSLTESYTWREVDQASDILAKSYLSLGLMPGDRLASLMPNRPALIVHYLACFKSGIVAVPLNYRYHTPQIDHALSVSGARMLLLFHERFGDIKDSAAAEALDLGYLSFGTEIDTNTRFETLFEYNVQDVRLPKPKADWPLAIFFTSGSTGPAKGVTHTHRSFEYMIASCAQGLEISSGDIMAADCSHSHIAGFYYSFSSMSKGARILLATNTEPGELLQLLRKERPTVLFMIPAAFFSVVRDQDATAEDFSSLRLMRAGADKVPLELEREFNELTGLVIDEGYGSTEMGVTTVNPPSGIIKAGSIGRPLPGFEISIRDDQGDEVPTGTEGNNWVKTKSIMSGYWKSPEDTRKVIVDGWFDSGDVLVADDDGYLRFRGRKKQIIVHDGSNISPQEVEESLLDHPAVESAGVIGIDDLVHGENVRAYVSIKENAKAPTATELIKFSRERIGYRAPDEIIFLDKIPINPTGKVDRLYLKQMAEAKV